MTRRATRRTAIAVAALAVCLVALIATALDAQHGGSSAAGPAPARIGAPIAAPDRSAEPPALAYAGPRHLAGESTLRARVRSAEQPIVAVTFFLDQKPVGTDTTAPYALDVDAALLPPGPHRLRVVAVDRVGKRTSSRAVTVRTGGSRDGMLSASPSSGFGEALAALARGHVTVLLAPGRYDVDHVELGSGARLVGAGTDTVLAATSPGWSLITARGRGVRISELAIDGGGLAERGVGVSPGSHDVRLQHVTIGGIRENAVEIWGEHSDVSVQDSTLQGAGANGAGVFDLGSDDTSDTSVVRTTISGFRGYGINFVQRDYDRPRAAARAVALDNRISDIQDPSAATGTHEGAIWSGGVEAAIIGNRVRDTGWDGIQTVGSSRKTTIVDNDVARTRTGIYLEHETTDSLIADNVITDVITGINSEWRYDGSGSGTNTLERNTVVRPSEAGIFIDVAGDGNRIADNLIADGGGPAIVLQGASDNEVIDNRACERTDDRLVVQQSAHYDDGRPAHSLRNRVASNTTTDACRAP